MSLKRIGATNYIKRLIDKAVAEVSGDKPLTSLSDVNILGTPNDGEALIWNSSLGEWQAQIVSAGGDTPSSIKSKYESNADTNVFSDIEKTKLSSLDETAEANVKSDWNASTGDAEILNKPPIPSYLNELQGSTDDVNQGSLNLFMRVKNSLEINQNQARLVGDSPTPGNNKFYGTGVTGTRGWFDISEEEFTTILKNKVDSIEDNATADQSGAEIKALYEAELDTNAFNDATFAKLAAIEPNATADMTAAEIKSAYESNADTNAFTNTLNSKLASIAPGATTDQTPAAIKTSYESNSNTNVFTDSEKSKLASLEDSKFLGTYTSLGALNTAHPSPQEGSFAHVDGGLGQDVEVYIWDTNDTQFVLQAGTGGSETAASIKTKYETNADTNAFTDTEKSKLGGIEAAATADQTGVEIKGLYEAEVDTNAFTDTEKTKLGNIEATATADQTGAEIKIAYEAEADTNAFTDAYKSQVDALATHAADVNNPHSVTKAQVGLGNVDNTTDIGKPVSTLTQSALDTKLDKGTGVKVSSGANYRIKADDHKYDYIQLTNDGSTQAGIVNVYIDDQINEANPERSLVTLVATNGAQVFVQPFGGTSVNILTTKNKSPDEDWQFIQVMRIINEDHVVIGGVA